MADSDADQQFHDFLESFDRQAYQKRREDFECRRRRRADELGLRLSKIFEGDRSSFRISLSKDDLAIVLDGLDLLSSGATEDWRSAEDRWWWLRRDLLDAGRGNLRPALREHGIIPDGEFEAKVRRGADLLDLFLRWRDYGALLPEERAEAVARVAPGTTWTAAHAKGGVKSDPLGESALGAMAALMGVQEDSLRRRLRRAVSVVQIARSEGYTEIAGTPLPTVEQLASLDSLS